jgi:hypothetical protein
MFNNINFKAINDTIHINESIIENTDELLLI